MADFIENGILQSVENNAAILFEKNLQFCKHIVNI